WLFLWWWLVSPPARALGGTRIPIGRKVLSQTTENGTDAAAAQLIQTAAQDFSSRRIQLRDPPLQICAEHTFTHALDDVFILGLQAGYLPAFVAQLASRLTKTFRQIARQVSNGEKTEQAGADFHLQGFEIGRQTRGCG